MTGSPAPDVAAILHAFADLAPEGAAAQVALDVTRTQGFAWLGTNASGFTARRPIDNRLTQDVLDEVARLAAFDELHRHEHRLREGWVFLAGRTTVDGDRREVCVPLLSAPVRLRKIIGAPTTPVDPEVGGHVPVWSRRFGDQEITALVADADDRARLEDDAEFGGGGLGEFYWESSHPQRFPRLVAWIEAVVEATGLPVERVEAPTDPRSLRRNDGLVAVIGSGLYAIETEDEPERRRSLRGWAGRPGIERTALATLYGDSAAPDAPDETVRSPFPLTPAQRRLVVRSRHDPLTVASGAPGTGKSHAVAAIAVDAVLRGESVLVATQSQHAAEVLADLLERHPGPTPVVFGNGERRDELLDELTDRLGRPLRSSDLAALDAAVDRAADGYLAARRLVDRSITLEADAAALDQWEAAIPALVAELPRVFDSGAPLDRIAELNDTVAAGPPSGWFSGFRHRRTLDQLIDLTGAEGTTTAAVPHRLVVDAVAAAAARRASLDLDARGGIRLSAPDGPSLWDRLGDAEVTLQRAIGERAAAHDRLPSSLTNKPRRAVAALLAALRAGRGQRRRLLAELDLAAVAHSVPLWVGNLHDIEDLLPATPGVFDLVILDEASQIDQPYGALALLRGRRAVVVGDPRQLRHVSFTSDADVRTTLEMRDLDHLADRLDLRRSSTFDAAAAAAPVTWLDEHHRSVPHLIEFSARRFYRDRVSLLTRHPTTHATRAIEVEPVDGTRGKDGVNVAQVERALELLPELGGDGRTVGIVTPFRAQADAIEAAILDRLGIDDIVALGLRTGTVHAFQGGERDAIVIALALDDDSPAGSRRFVEDPSLFNVMVTRARQQIVVLTSETESGGLLGDYLTWAGTPPSPPGGGAPASRWSDALGAELARAGHVVSHRYPVGTWEVDLVVGEGDSAVGIECGVHPDGSDAHIERHLTLTAAGWRLIDAFPSRWSGHAARAAVELEL